MRLSAPWAPCLCAGYVIMRGSGCLWCKYCRAPFFSHDGSACRRFLPPKFKSYLPVKKKEVISDKKIEELKASIAALQNQSYVPSLPSSILCLYFVFFLNLKFFLTGRFLWRLLPTAMPGRRGAAALCEGLHRATSGGPKFRRQAAPAASSLSGLQPHVGF